MSYKCESDDATGELEDVSELSKIEDEKPGLWIPFLRKISEDRKVNRDSVDGVTKISRTWYINSRVLAMILDYNITIDELCQLAIEK